MNLIISVGKIDLNFFKRVNLILKFFPLILMFIGGYRFIKRNYEQAENKLLFWLIVFIVVFVLISPFIVLLVTEPTK
ncbi:hypothetical protein [Orenia marismortui]|uniref:hypothetical protein n=1 Tax=Orenia marismortui TaxID=46469 RepID=UPI0003780E50|nr:hypothetical protein [Orenia marismortui]